MVCEVLVDLFRLIIYGISFFSKDFEKLSAHGGLVLVAMAMVAAFFGSFIGTRLNRKVMITLIKQLEGGMLLLLAIALGRVVPDPAFALCQFEYGFSSPIISSVCGNHHTSGFDYRIHLFTFGKA